MALVVELEGLEKRPVAHETPDPGSGPEPDLRGEDAFQPWLAPGPAPGAAADIDALPDGLDAELEALFDACHGWDFAACDELYRVAPYGSDAELFGGTCGGWLLDAVSGGCAELEYLGGLLLACQGGDGFACDALYELAPFGSALEQFAGSCGWRYVAPVAGTCSLGT